MVYAGLLYCYSLELELGGDILKAEELIYLHDESGILEDGARYIPIIGFSPQITDAVLKDEQTSLSRPGGDWGEEEFMLLNLGSFPLMITNLDFSFGKPLHDTISHDWDPLMKRHKLFAIPFLANPVGEYNLHPLHTLQNRNMPDRLRMLSEAWARSDGDTGIVLSHFVKDLIRMCRAKAVYASADIELRFGGSGADIEKEAEGRIIYLTPKQKLS